VQPYTAPFRLDLQFNFYYLIWLQHIKIAQMEKLNALKELVAAAEKDGALFYGKNNNAAGTRFRKTLQEIKALATELRKDVTDKKNNTK
jgi:hypothetical protein